MGWGDELMAAGQARLLAEAGEGPVAILDRRGVVRNHDAWRGIDYIVRDPGARSTLVNGPGARPYIDYTESNKRRWKWRDFKPTPARLVFDEAERAFGAAGAGRLVIEPNIKPTASPNKDWGFDRWQKLVRARPDLPWSQLAGPGSRVLAGVSVVPSPSFRHSAAFLAAARAYIGPEGGLHHAAAAGGVRAVVVFGGFIGPEQTGYLGPRNLTSGGPACGSRQPCEHCRAAMLGISINDVLNAIERVLA